MGSIINTNIAAIRTHNVYNRNDINMNAALTRVATGMKINSAKDGASTWAISEKMRERIRANDQANQNVQNDTALLKTAQGGVSNTIDILKTLKERAINAANDSNMNTDRDRIATEVEQLLEQINDNAAKVKFNGRTLLDGTGATDQTGGAFKTNEVAATDEIVETNTQLAVFKFDLTTGFPTDFYDESATPAAERTLGNVQKTSGTNNFSANNVVELTWKDENGDDQKTTYTVDTAKTVSDMAAALTDESKGIYVSFLKSTSDYITSDGETRVTDADTKDIKATGEGLYIVGLNGAISDVKINVLTAAGGAVSANGNAVFGGSATAAGEATEVQEAAETGEETATAEYKGDHSVFAIEGLGGTVTSGVAANLATTTNLKDLTLGLKSIVKDSSFTAASGDMIKFTYGEGDNDYVELDYSTSTVANLQAAFAAKGINVQILGEGDQLRDASDNMVLETGYESTPLRAGAAGLYFVGPAEADVVEGTTAPLSITSMKITLTDASESNAEVALQKGMATAAPVVEYEDPNATEEATVPTTDLTFYIGGEQNFGITASISSMKVEDLFSGYDSNSFANLFTDQKTAETALDKINTALDTALNEQTKLGALEARLGYTSDNLTTMNENLEAADSTMRDSDIAKEMTNYMKYSVLAQASQYMLAQSSQNAFSVLNLLQA